MKNKYRFNVSIEFEAYDDIDARRMASVMREGIAPHCTMGPHDISIERPLFKLQRMHDNRPPEGVRLGTEKKDER